MLAKTCRRIDRWPFLLIPPVALLIYAGVSAGTPAGDAAALPWRFLALLGASGMLVAVAVYLWFGDPDQRRRDRLLRDRLDRLDGAAAISNIGGRVIWTNRAACPAGAKPPRSVLDLFAARTEINAQTIYRIATAAQRLGFGAERVKCNGGDGACILFARPDMPDTLVWIIVPAEGLPLGAPATPLYADAPFGYLAIGPDGAMSANGFFRTTFAYPAASAAIAEIDPGDTDGQRLLLTGGDGHEILCHVFPEQSSADASAPRGFFVFPFGESSAERGGSVAALEAVPVALMQLDLEGRVLWHNRLARDMIGRDMEPGTPLPDLVISLGRPLATLLANADADGDTRGLREMLRLRGAGESFLQISVTRVTLDGSPTLLAVLSDASELRQLEDKFVQSQKMEAVGKLAGGVAHDFNNVLTAISGHSDLLLLGKDAQHPDYSDLVQIRQNTHRAAALVRQLLAFSRKQTLNPTLLSVQDVVSDTQYLLNRLIGERVTLVVEHGGDLGAVQADRQQLEQALMNLVVNARDAMPDGGIITIATRNRHFGTNTSLHKFEIPAGDYVEIAVADRGTGIDPRHLDRVFDPFFTTKPQGEGTGLGLATVYGIVKQSGGYIFAENRRSGGACFRIVLPRAESVAVEPDTTEGESGAASAEARRDLTGRGAILLVEDEDPVRAFASRALRLRGYEVREAVSAEDAMTVLDDSDTRIDLLVSDVVMPGTDGPTLAAHARRKRPGLRVVFISGYAEDSFRRNIVEHDFLFLAKPFSLVELTAKVKEAIGNADAPPEG